MEVSELRFEMYLNRGLKEKSDLMFALRFEDVVTTTTPQQDTHFVISLVKKDKDGDTVTIDYLGIISKEDVRRLAKSS